METRAETWCVDVEAHKKRRYRRYLLRSKLDEYVTDESQGEIVTEKGLL